MVPHTTLLNQLPPVHIIMIKLKASSWFDYYPCSRYGRTEVSSVLGQIRCRYNLESRQDSKVPGKAGSHLETPPSSSPVSLSTKPDGLHLEYYSLPLRMRAIIISLL